MEKINVQITKMEESLKTCRAKKHIHHEISVTNQVFSLVKYYTTHSLPIKLQLVCCFLPINYRLQMTNNFTCFQSNALKI